MAGLMIKRCQNDSIVGGNPRRPAIVGLWQGSGM